MNCSSETAGMANLVADSIISAGRKRERGNYSRMFLKLK